MRYVITAKNIQTGDVTVTDPRLRTEICTELIMTRLKVIEMLNEGVITSENVTIVTRIDRRCLYDNLFKHVIDWNDFVAMRNQIESDQIIDLASQIYELDTTIEYKPFYQRYEKDKAEIHNIAVDESIDPSQPFICVLIRTTPNNPEKNLSHRYWMQLIDGIYHKYKGKMNVFVFGVPDEDFLEDVWVCKDNPASPWVHSGISLTKFLNWDCSPRPASCHVKTFKEWCTLLGHKNCRAVISTTTGGVYPIYFVRSLNEIRQMFIIDNNSLISIHGDSPSFYNQCINFTNVHLHQFQGHVPEVDALIKSIEEHAKL